jgi:hypothetical protein
MTGEPQQLMEGPEKIGDAGVAKESEPNFAKYFLSKHHCNTLFRRITPRN